MFDSNGLSERSSRMPQREVNPPMIEDTLLDFERARIPIEYGKTVGPTGITYWARSGDVSVDGFRYLGKALNSVWIKVGRDAENKKELVENRAEDLRMKKYAYLGEFGTVFALDSGYKARPIRGKEMTFPTAEEAVDYLKSVSGWKKKRSPW